MRVLPPYGIFPNRFLLMEWICETCSEDRFIHGVEVGVQAGNFSAEILQTKVNKLDLVDCWLHQDDIRYKYDPANVIQSEQDNLFEWVNNRFKDEILKGRVSVYRKFSVQAAKFYNNKSLSFVYLDANHSYGSVIADLCAWRPKIKDGGFLCGHDFCVNGNSLQCGYEVYDAVSDWSFSNKLRINAVTNESWASFAINIT